VNQLEDEPNSYLSEANLLAVGDSVTGRISSASDTDLFEVHITAPGVYQIDFASSAPSGQWSFWVEAYDIDINRVAGGSVGWGLGATHTFVAREAGTYYLQVASNSALVTTPYTLTLTQSAIPIASYESGTNRSLATADTIVLDRAITGALTNGDGSAFFKVIADASGLLKFHVAPPAEAPVALYLLNVYDDAGRMVKSGYAAGEQDIFVSADSQATYTVEVRGGNTDSSPFSVEAHLDVLSALTPVPVALGASAIATMTAGVADWYSVELTAGQLCAFDVLGADSGKGTLADPSVAVFGPGLVPLGSLDDTRVYDGGDYTLLEPSLGFVAPRDGTYYVRVDGNGAGGTYQLTPMPDTASTLLQTLLHLQHDPDARWNAPAALGSAIHLTYSFLSSTADGVTSFVTMNSSERAAVRQALALYAASANITFTESLSGSAGQLRFGRSDLSGVDAAGFTHVESDAQGTYTRADVFMERTFTDYSAGTFAYETLLHEIGHALGLKHPGDYNLDGSGDAPFAPSAFDNATWTVMSYVEALDGASTTPRVLDTAAVQYLYGANVSQAGQSKVYTFDAASVAGQGLFASGAAITFDLSKQSVASTVNLAPGSFSSIGKTASGQLANDNVFLPFGALANKVISSAAGDTIVGAASEDTVVGFAGRETIDLAGGTNTLALKATSADFNSAADGQLANVQVVDLTGATAAVVLDLRGQSEQVDVRASAYNDVITLGAAGETVHAGAGSATIAGGAGVDTLAFDAQRSAFTMTSSADGFTVAESAKAAHVQAISGVEHLRFSDMSVNLGIGETATLLAPADLKTLEELYVAFFNREPDADGLQYWMSQFHAGQSLASIADGFYGAAVLYSDLTHYSAGMSQADFVRVIYANVLGRSGGTAPPDEDVSYWAGRLASGADTRGSLVTTMLASASSFKGNATWGWVADLLDNKAAVAHWLAVQEGITYNDAQTSITKGMAIAAAVTATDTHAAITLAGVGDLDFSLFG
jgi:hypothetical protein